MNSNGKGRVETAKTNVNVESQLNLRADVFAKLQAYMQAGRDYEAACNAGGVHAEGDPLTNMAIAGCEFARAEKRVKP